MKRYLITLLCCFSITVVFAESCNLTVVAESGLKLRKEPNLKSESLAVAQFGETVLAGTCNFHSPELVDNIIEIDGEKGFWLAVRYKEISGYMFSGFLVVGEIFPHAATENMNPVVLTEIFDYAKPGSFKADSFDYRLYRPGLYWYGIKVDEISTHISKTNVVPVYDNERWNRENQGSDDVYMQVENGERFDFLFGAAALLDTGIIASQYHSGCENGIGIFLYPEQEYLIEFNHSVYKLRASEELSINENAETENRINRAYTIDLALGRKEVEIQNKKNIFELSGSANLNAIHKSIQVFWSGDLNGDGYLEFIFEITPKSETCGAYAALRLIYSELQTDGRVLYKSNEGLLFGNFKAYGSY